MARIKVSATIDASPAEVWDVVRHVDRHVDWMTDAEAIHFTSPRREGKGTTFDCHTRVGPFRLTDRMEITRWRPGRAMGVRHVGLVTGEGAFTLRPVRRSRGDRTRFTWQERLVFPWWMGGPVGGIAGGRVLELVWRRNLLRLKSMIEDGG